MKVIQNSFSLFWHLTNEKKAYIYWPKIEKVYLNLLFDCKEKTKQTTKFLCLFQKCMSIGGFNGILSAIYKIKKVAFHLAIIDQSLAELRKRIQCSHCSNIALAIC